ncbi:hypothetical protein QBC43DRAFT_284450 [Cladorrhinum sp. PSN259]|nr:hypothetical protein QBC43DRAFT_284450 [Cladorrhinum sp. PSN259]
MDSSRYTTTRQSTSTMPSQHQSPSMRMKMVSPQPSHNKSSSASATSTDAFLQDFTLVAEAAKRAQMAVMMRDFESIGLQ